MKKPDLTAGLSFEEAKLRRDDLDVEVELATTLLRAFPHLPNGLVPDEVRERQKWKEASARFTKAFRALREFNGCFVKRFKKELKEERDARQVAREQNSR